MHKILGFQLRHNFLTFSNNFSPPGLVKSLINSSKEQEKDNRFFVFTPANWREMTFS